ncbi:MAG: GldG family protein [Deltaproteobacteria bacterium]|nr:GldG family protein [Deltaproteobacteria bacterium]
MAKKIPQNRRGKILGGLNAAAISLIVAAIVILINFIATRYNIRWDLTENREFTLSPQSIKVARELQQPVKILGFFKAGEKPLFLDLVERYRYYSKKIDYQFVDPDVEASLTKRYSVDKYRTIVVEAGGNEARADDATEEKLTEAIIKALRTEKKEVCFLQGHGEKDLDDQEREGFARVKEELEKASLVPRKFSLLEEPSIPSTCKILVIAGASKPFFPNEIPVLEEFAAKQGGNLLIMADPQTETGIESLLSKWGVTLHNDLIVDMRARILGADYTIPVVTDYPPGHKITEGFKIVTLYPLARSLAVAPSLPKGIRSHILAVTSPNSWGETVLKDGNARFDEGRDFKGPLPVAAALEIEGEETQEENRAADEQEGAVAPVEKKKESVTASREDQKDPKKKENGEKKEKAENSRKVGNVVVFGNSNFANNQYFHFSGNGDLFLNTVSFLTEDTALISIRPKSKAEHRIFLSPIQWAFISYGVRWGAPVIIFLVGLQVWWRRRKL